MTRTKDQILAELDPTRPDTIQALIDLHRSMFGRFVMELEDDKGEKSTEDEKSSEDDGSKDEKGGENRKGGDRQVLADLAGERKARQALERKVTELESNRVDPKKLAEALGIKTPDDKSSAADVTTALQQRLDAMEQENRLYRVAAKHKITDEGDLDLLKGITDESAMDKLAARLASASRDGDDSEKDKNGKRRAPAADKSQGRGNDGNGNRPTSVREVQEARRAARDAKSK